jgi:hypothetical protein
MSNDLELAGQRALVTGGTKRIGEAVAARLRGAFRARNGMRSNPIADSIWSSASGSRRKTRVSA